MYIYTDTDTPARSLRMSGSFCKILHFYKSDRESVCIYKVSTYTNIKDSVHMCQVSMYIYIYIYIHTYIDR